MSQMIQQEIQSNTVKQYTYFAFISYKREDSTWAKWLQGKLQSYRLPSKLCKQYAGLPRRLSPVFLDKTDLTSGKLEESLHDQTASSKFLIVICSKHTHDHPKYINLEIQSFLDSGHSPSQIIPFIVDQSEAPEQECFPSKLQEICAQESILGVNIHDAGSRLAFLKVIAYMQGIKLTEIESADDRRRRKNRRLATLCACLLVAMVTITGFSHYDYYVPKVEYYLDYTTQYGVPVGIVPLSEDDIAKMYAHYVIRSVNHQVTELTYENSAGYLTIHHDTEKKERPTKMVFCYREDGTLDTATCYNATGKAEMVLDYDNNMTVVDLKRYNEYSTSMTLHALGEASNSSVGRYIQTYDENGYMVQQLYAKFGTNIRAADTNGIWGKKYQYDVHGRMVQMRYLAYTSQKTYVEVASKLDVYGESIEYDENNDLIKYTYFGKDMQPVFNDQKWMIRKSIFDSAHNVIKESYCNGEEQLVFTEEGISGSTNEYDERGNVIRETYFGKDGQPVLSKNGYAGCVSEYDERGNLIRTAYFGKDGKPVLDSDGCAGATFEYDGRGNIIRITYFGLDGQPVLNNDGYAAEEVQYDEQENILRVAYFGTDGQPIKSNQGYASLAGWINEYDEYGNVTKTAYFGKDGQPISRGSSFGYAGETNEYDERGNVTKVTYINTDGQPIGIAYDYAGRTTQYDDCGNIIRIAYFKTDGQPALLKDGYVGLKYEYNERGYLIQTNYFGIDEQPVLSTDGYAGCRYEYGEHDNIIRVVHFGTDGEPVMTKYGYMGWTNEYDKQSNITKCSYFGTENQPVLCKHGYASVTYNYDEYGNVIRTVYSGTDGQPTLSWTNEYDDRGNIIQTVYFGIDSQPVLIKNAYAGWTDEYDERGNVIRRAYFGIDGEPALYDNNYYAYEKDYDQNGKMTSEKYFGVDKKLAIAKIGFAVKKYAYDNNGTIQQTVTYNENMDAICINKYFRNSTGPFDQRDIMYEWTDLTRSRNAKLKAKGDISLQEDQTEDQCIEVFYTVENGCKKRTLKYINTEGTAIICEKGYCYEEWNYDSSGSVNLHMYYDVNHQPVGAKEELVPSDSGDSGEPLENPQMRRKFDDSGKLLCQYSYDENGNISEYVQYENTGAEWELENKEVPQVTGYCKIEVTHNDEEQISSIAIYLHEDGPVSQIRNYVDSVLNEVITYKDLDDAAPFQYRKTIYDEYLDIISVEFFGDNDELTLGPDGYARCIYSYDIDYINDNITLLCQDFYNQFSERSYSLEYKGKNIIHKTYNEFDEVIRSDYVDEDGIHITGNDGYSCWKYEYDMKHHIVKTTFYDLLGKLVLCKDGYAGWKSRYDGNGNLVRIDYFDTEENRTAGVDGIAGFINEYDADGKKNRTIYFDYDDRTVYIKEYLQSYIVKRFYDQNMNECRVEFLNNDGLYDSESNGYAGWMCEYDNHNRRVRIAFFDADGKGALCRNGYAIQTDEYNERGDIVREAYFGTSGEPVSNKEGYASWTNEYDEQGNVIRTINFDTNGEIISIQE